MTVTPSYLILLMFSRTVPSRVYEVWIFFICFLVICIILHLTGWNLIPHFLAQHPNDLYLSILCILNFSVTNTVIRKESYFRINVCWNIINVQRKQQGTKDSALWDTIQNQGPIRVCSIYNNSPPLPVFNSLMGKFTLLKQDASQKCLLCSVK